MYGDQKKTKKDPMDWFFHPKIRLVEATFNGEKPMTKKEIMDFFDEARVEYQFKKDRFILDHGIEHHDIKIINLKDIIRAENGSGWVPDFFIFQKRKSGITSRGTKIFDGRLNNPIRRGEMEMIFDGNFLL